MEPENTPPLKKRAKSLLLLTSIFLLIALGVFFYWFKWARFHEYTNDAYVSGNLVYVTPQVSGITTTIYVDNTQLVEEGHPLIELDPLDFQITLYKTQAELGEVIRNVSQLFVETKKAQAQVEVAKAAFLTAAQDFERRQSLILSGSVSQEDFTHAENTLSSSYFSLVAAEQAYLALVVQVENTTVLTHPRVQKKVEELKTAWIALKRCRIVSPVKGLVAQRTVQVGQRVNPAEPLLAIVPLNQVWVDANFKEVQIGKMQIGQKASLTSDIYGNQVEYHGRIVGIGGGTGSVFSILPPQNATGNWIKIVQRVPIRIAIDPLEVYRNPLRLGLSMEVTVDIHDIGHSQIPLLTLPSAAPLYQTDVFAPAKEEEGFSSFLEKIFLENFSPQDGIS